MSFDERGGSDARLDSVTSIAADGEEYRKDDDEEADAVLTPVPLSIRAADSCSVVKVRNFDCPLCRLWIHVCTFSNWNIPVCSHFHPLPFQAFIGSNYLGVPYSFHLCGIALAVPLFWAIAFFSRQGCRLLIDCKIELDRRDKDQCDNATYGRSSGSSSDGGGCGSAYALADDGVGSGSVDESAGRLRRTSHGHAANHTTSTSSPSQPLLSASSSFISAASSSSLQTSSPRATVTAIDHASSSDSSESDHAGGGYAIVGERLFGARMAHLVRACLVLTQVSSAPCVDEPMGRLAMIASIAFQQLFVLPHRNQKIPHQWFSAPHN